jgi:hypothetical protein
MSRRTIVAVTLAAMGLSCIATPARAQDGVTVDPNSPSGKEYALPLEDARRQASGTDSSPSPAGTTPNPSAAATPPPAFGAGIVADHARSSSRRSGAKHRARSRARSQAELERLPAADRAVLSAGGFSTALWSAGGAGLMLLVAGGAALLVRRTRRGAR